MATAPITSVLMLRDLGFTAWQYGLTIGLPCLSGLMGSVLTPRLVTRLGQHRTLLVFGVAKTLFVAPWMLLLVAPVSTPRPVSCPSVPCSGPRVVGTCASSASSWSACQSFQQ